MNDKSLRVLMVDDSEDDVLLIIRDLKRGGYNPVYERVQTASSMKKALKEKQWDIILCDYKMPKFDAPSALAILKETNLDIPAIIISGTIGEETAIECMRLGARDYFMKSKLSRLCAAIARELEEAEIREKQKQAESQKEAVLEELHQSEEKYRTILENMQDAYFEVDLAGNFTFFNDAMCHDFGYSKDELMGMNYRQYTDHGNAKILFQAYNKVYTSGESLKELFWQITRKDGSKKYIEGSVSLRKDSSGKPIGFRGIIRDVTERKRTEQELRESEKYFKEITENSSDIIIITDKNGDIKYCSRSVERFIGYKPEELIGRSTFAFIYPDDVERAVDDFGKAVMAKDSAIPNALRIVRKDGSVGHFDGLGKNFLDNPAIAGFIINMRDITESKQVEEKLRESEELYTRLVDAIPDIIVRTDLEGKIIFVNDYALQISGYSRGELEDHNILTFISSEEHERLIHEISLMLERRLGPREYNLLAKDGRKIPLETNGDVLRNEDGTPFGLVTVSRDITERKQAESQREALLEKLRVSESKLIEAQEMAHLGHWIWDVKTGKVEWSEEVFKIFQLDPDSFTPQIDSIQDLSPWPEDHERDKELIRKAAESHEGGSYEQRFLRPDKSTGYYFSSFQGKYDNNGNLVFIVGTVQDITERKQTEMKIAGMNRALLMRSNTDKVLVHIANESMLLNEVCRIIVEVGGYLMAWVGFAEQDEAKTVRPVAHAGLDSGYIESANITWADNERGRGPGGTAIRTGQTCIARNIQLDPAFAPWRKAAIKRGYKSNIALPLISEGRTFGELAIYSVEADAFDAKEVEILKEMADDLAFGVTILRTRIKQDQTALALHESEERYRLIAENTADTIAVFDLNFNLTYVSPSMLKLRGYTVQEAMTQTLNLMLTPDSLQRASKMLADQITLEASGNTDPARTTLIELEEYCKDGSTIWVELAASFLRDKNLKPTGILTLTRNITERKQAEVKLQQTLDSLRNAVSTTIKVLVSALEARDPYTAGHQLRVADLARAIATEMGLDQDKVDGIRMAGSIHDIGKLSIPAEILSKPTKLTNLEFSLIKEHSQIGYDMLKDVGSPWPLAQIVYQHHERFNGTGYPQKLKGDEILLEARIMAVADVVEAMASHRPYRAGLGIDVALEEIEKNKGVLYDPAVADACLRLFLEKGYQLPLQTN
jgi:PAS domain S-box-containing protein/putative nucleotidyltransferase with HDIG domain